MRNAACSAWVELFKTKPFAFLTGDLGFRALEPLREVMGDMFINAGVAEQNMVSVAAGMASRGMDVWVYSIAPFCYARPFEQIRNDVCLHEFPVKLVGNGGGYAYGPMGASHHALEDYGVLLGLQKMHALVPAFDSDVEPMVQRLSAFDQPAYLRLGRCELPDGYDPPPYTAWRKLLSGEGVVVVAMGPLAGALVTALRLLEPASRPDLWVLSELPLGANPVPPVFLEDLRRARRICVVEEHVAHGGLGQSLAHYLLTRGMHMDAFDHACAKGYPSGDYGSQGFHRKECGLDTESLLARFERLRGRP